MKLEFDNQLQMHFPELMILVNNITNVRVERQDDELNRFSEELIGQTLRQYKLDTLKGKQTVRAYRDFFWKVKIDPTKNRPAAEALIRRVLRRRKLPRINTLVDAYNLASIQTEIAFAAFDADKLRGTLLVRFTETGEEFLGIGMKKPMVLKGGEIIISDEEKIVAIYPYRDSEETKITEKTKNCMLLVCGVPGVRKEELSKALFVALENITRFCGGESEMENCCYPDKPTPGFDEGL